MNQMMAKNAGYLSAWNLTAAPLLQMGCDPVQGFFSADEPAITSPVHNIHMGVGLTKIRRQGGDRGRAES